MSTSLGFDCNAVIVDMVTALENGDQVFPRFFADFNCQYEWPPPGTLLQSNVTYKVGTNLCKTNSVADCPAPFISVMLVPEGSIVEFYAKSHPNVAFPGQINLASRPPNPKGLSYLDRMYTPNLISALTNNLWMRESYADQPSKPWGDQSQHGKLDVPCAQNTIPDGKTADGLYGWSDDAKTLVKRGLVSCGSPFWPSFIEASQSLTTENGQWSLSDGTVTSNGTFKCVSAPIQFGSQSRVDKSFPLAGIYSMVVEQRVEPFNRDISKGCFTGRYGTPMQFQTPVFSTIDCVASRETYLNNSGACSKPPGDSVRILDCDTCDPQYLIQGSVDSFIVKTDDWDMQRFIWCIADPKDKPTFYGYPLQRYQAGSAFCDQHVTELCQDTGIVQQNKAFAVACQCILQQQKLKVEYAGLDVPVQCFLNVCDGSTDGVYRTSGQQRGCTAKICQQVIALNGSGIISSGKQQLECNGKVYNVQDEVINMASGKTDFDPNILAPKVSSGFHLGREFYVALGFLVIVFFLLLLWGLHRWEEQREMQKYKKEREAELLAKVISYKPPEDYGVV